MCLLIYVAVDTGVISIMHCNTSQSGLGNRGLFVVCL